MAAVQVVAGIGAGEAAFGPARRLNNGRNVMRRHRGLDGTVRQPHTVADLSHAASSVGLGRTLDDGSLQNVRRKAFGDSGHGSFP